MVVYKVLKSHQLVQKMNFLLGDMINEWDEQQGPEIWSYHYLHVCVDQPFHELKSLR